MTKTAAPSRGSKASAHGEGLLGRSVPGLFSPHSLTARSPDNGNQTPAHPRRVHGCAGWTLLSPDLHVGVLGCPQTRAQSAVCEQCSEQEPLTPGFQPRRQLPTYTGGLTCWGPFPTPTPPPLSSNPFCVQCYIDGPYGTPTRRIFASEHAVLIGAGIGITPFASILQSILYRWVGRLWSYLYPGAES